MKRLILMRHAKSSWDDITLRDHDRPLNARGIKACATMGAWLAENNHLPQSVICSTATRCMETWERTGLAMGHDAPVDYVGRLYHASPETMLGVLHGAKGDTVMMLAHNPGISGFASELVGTNRPDHMRFTYFPTAAIAVIDFDTDEFDMIRPGQGKCTDFTIPRDLEQ